MDPPSITRSKKAPLQCARSAVSPICRASRADLRLQADDVLEEPRANALAEARGSPKGNLKPICTSANTPKSRAP
jgi:hypothetical protein